MLGAGLHFLTELYKGAPFPIAVCLTPDGADTRGSLTVVHSPYQLWRVYFKGNPNPSDVAQEAKRYATPKEKDGKKKKAQIGNEENNPIELWVGGPEAFGRFFRQVVEECGDEVDCFYPAPSPSIPGQEQWWKGVEYASGIAARAYGTLEEMKHTLWWVLQNTPERNVYGEEIEIVVAECNFGPDAIKEVNKDEWAVHHFLPFLQWASTFKRVKGVCYYADAWPTPDTPTKTPVDALGTKIIDVMHAFNATLTSAPVEEEEEEVVSNLKPAAILPYWQLIQKESLDHNLDPFQVGAMIWLESNGVASVVNTFKAVGLMQVVARENSNPVFRNRPTVAQLQVPETNVHWGCALLDGFRKAHGGDLKRGVYEYSGGKSWENRYGTAGWTKFQEMYWSPMQAHAQKLKGALTQMMPTPQVVVPRWRNQNDSNASTLSADCYLAALSAGLSAYGFDATPNQLYALIGAPADPSRGYVIGDGKEKIKAKYGIDLDWDNEVTESQLAAYLAARRMVITLNYYPLLPAGYKYTEHKGLPVYNDNHFLLVNRFSGGVLMYLDSWWDNEQQGRIWMDTPAEIAAFMASWSSKARARSARQCLVFRQPAPANAAPVATKYVVGEGIMARMRANGDEPTMDEDYDVPFGSVVLGKKFMYTWFRETGEVREWARR